MTDGEMVVIEPSNVQLGTLHADSAASLVEGASAMATVLSDVIERQKLYIQIGKRKHVMVEGWTTLAIMLGCTPREVENVDLGDGTYVAVVELVRMRDGVVVSRASSECGMDEPTWAERAKYARRSMAATRATGKACRLAFSWIMTLAGYEPTPAEEMPQEHQAGPDPAFRRGAGEGKPKAAAAAPDQISEPQARRIVAMARAAGEKHEQHGFHVVASVLKACDLPPFPPKAKMDETMIHLREHVAPSDYDDFCGLVEHWEPNK